jgi:hypothetical protein
MHGHKKAQSLSELVYVGGPNWNRASDTLILKFKKMGVLLNDKACPHSLGLVRV